jgi:hypothetical protein
MAVATPTTTPPTCSTARVPMNTHSHQFLPLTRRRSHRERGSHRKINIPAVVSNGSVLVGAIHVW